MLIFSMGVTLDGYVADSDGRFDWGAPSPDLFAFHVEQVDALGAYILGRRLYEAMRVWETDPSMRRDDDTNRFADIWAALPKVVFSRTLDRVEGNARLATAPLADEIAETLALGADVEIGGAMLAAAAIDAGLVGDFRMFRSPVIVGGGTPYFPPGRRRVRLDLVETRSFDNGVVFERRLRV